MRGYRIPFNTILEGREGGDILEGTRQEAGGTRGEGRGGEISWKVRKYLGRDLGPGGKGPGQACVTSSCSVSFSSFH